ncbi:uncharacterized protein [Panulirus ornatus]|uniref:uncharacterized protein isoform X3 n=1 Tax=Panulirus ornatus TaxID=150431 RepID=UPI003A863388
MITSLRSMVVISETLLAFIVSSSFSEMLYFWHFEALLAFLVYGFLFETLHWHSWSGLSCLWFPSLIHTTSIGQDIVVCF